MQKQQSFTQSIMSKKDSQMYNELSAYYGHQSFGRTQESLERAYLQMLGELQARRDAEEDDYEAPDDEEYERELERRAISEELARQIAQEERDYVQAKIEAADAARRGKHVHFEGEDRYVRPPPTAPPMNGSSWTPEQVRMNQQVKKMKQRERDQLEVRYKLHLLDQSVYRYFVGIGYLYDSALCAEFIHGWYEVGINGRMVLRQDVNDDMCKLLFKKVHGYNKRLVAKEAYVAIARAHFLQYAEPSRKNNVLLDFHRTIKAAEIYNRQIDRDQLITFSVMVISPPPGTTERVLHFSMPKKATLAEVESYLGARLEREVGRLKWLGRNVPYGKTLEELGVDDKVQFLETKGLLGGGKQTMKRPLDENGERKLSGHNFHKARDEPKSVKQKRDVPSDNGDDQKEKRRETNAFENLEDEEVEINEDESDTGSDSSQYTHSRRGRPCKCKRIEQRGKLNVNGKYENNVSSNDTHNHTHEATVDSVQQDKHDHMHNVNVTGKSEVEEYHEHDVKVTANSTVTETKTARTKVQSKTKVNSTVTNKVKSEGKTDVVATANVQHNDNTTTTVNATSNHTVDGKTTTTVTAEAEHHVTQTVTATNTNATTATHQHTNTATNRNESKAYHYHAAPHVPLPAQPAPPVNLGVNDVEVKYIREKFSVEFTPFLWYILLPAVYFLAVVCSAIALSCFPPMNVVDRDNPNFTNDLWYLYQKQLFYRRRVTIHRGLKEKLFKFNPAHVSDAKNRLKALRNYAQGLRECNGLNKNLIDETCRYVMQVNQYQCHLDERGVIDDDDVKPSNPESFDNPSWCSASWILGGIILTLIFITMVVLMTSSNSETTKSLRGSRYLLNRSMSHYGIPSGAEETVVSGMEDVSTSLSVMTTQIETLPLLAYDFSLNVIMSECYKIVMTLNSLLGRRAAVFFLYWINTNEELLMPLLIMLIWIGLLICLIQRKSFVKTLGLISCVMVGYMTITNLNLSISNLNGRNLLRSERKDV